MSPTRHIISETAAVTQTKDGQAQRELRVRLWVLGLLTLLAAAAVVAHFTVVPPFEPRWGILGNFLDVKVYRAGGDVVLKGLPLYEGPVFAQMHFTYTPFAALLFAPLAVLPEQLVVVGWTVAILVALALVVALCWKQLGYRLTPQVWAVSILGAVLATYLEPVRTTINYAQINVFLMLIVLWDLGRPTGSRLRGVGVGLAAAIKLTPAFFLVYLFITRQFRALVVALGTLAGTIVLAFAVLPRDSLRYFTGVLVDSDRIGASAAPSNQSVGGVLIQVLDDPTPPFALWLVCTALVGLASLAAVWLAHRDGHVLLAVTLTGLTACAVSPFSWAHHWVWWVPLIVVLANAAIVSGKWLYWFAPVAVAAATLAWSHRFAPDFVGIGLFMFLPGPPFEVLAQCVFVATHLVVVAATIGYFLRSRRAVR